MNGPHVVAFLQHRLRRVPGKLLVIWDGALIHRCRAVKQCRAFGAAQRLKLLALPGYAPDLNPDEGVWRWLKRVARHRLLRDARRTPVRTSTGLRLAAAAQGRVRSMHP
jgi:transposase